MMWITDDLIYQHVLNKTFVDVGPLWETIHEKVSTAHYFKAASVAAIDQWPEEHPLWLAFHERMHKLNVIDYQCYSMNVMDYTGPGFDVVYCSGVIYHAADTVGLLKKLRAITKERLILTSTITKKFIANDEGTLTIPDGSALFVPAMSPRQKAILTKEWSDLIGDRPNYGLSGDCVWRADDYYNWWWLFTPEVLDAMCVSCGFHIERTETIGGHLYVMSLKV